jgi:hypothetical protein
MSKKQINHFVSNIVNDVKKAFNKSDEE